MKKLLTLLAFAITLIVSAQAPQGFNYQATVRNSAGALITNQNVLFKFNIMQNSQTSLPVYSETHQAPTDDLGQVNLTVGTGTATTGTFAGINWGSGTYYLGIELNTGANFVAMGTTQLLSVPYALYANSAGSSQSQGKPSIYLTGDITNAEAAARIASQLGPVTENIYIQNTTQLTTVDLSAMEYAADISIADNNVLTSINLSGLKDCYSDLLIYSNPLLTNILFPALTNSRNIYINENPLLTTISFPDLTNSRNIELYSNALSIATINSLLNKMLSVLPSTGKYIDLSGQTPPAPPSGQGLIDKQTLIAAGNVVFTDNDTTFELDPLNFEGTIADGEVVLNSGTVYKLTGALIVADGATLTIPAGTRIEGVGGTASYIAVAQGGKININGTASNPVIMTSGLAVKAPGDWGGLVICGKAPINRVTGGASTAQSEVAELTYGGTTAADNSGSIRYLRLEYCGAAFNSEKEFNGLSLFGVGSGTTVEFVQTFHGADDGFEFFGGTVNTSNLVAFGNEDDQFDWTEGWNGTNTNWYGKISFGKGNRGIEADNFELGFANTPLSNPTINNITLVGPGSTAASATFPENDALKLRRGTRGIFSNVHITGFADAFDVEHDECIAAVTAGTLDAANVTFVDVTRKSTGRTTAVPPATSGGSADVSAVFAETTTATGAGSGASIPTWATGWTLSQ
ncbi:hypothetical protein [Flavobacterium sp.]|jgi:hypothetical protein|uniref:hypothetical protein n=1 Tax=Flavobacterium sp. TaxID=239 RepID=UPI0037BF5581